MIFVQFFHLFHHFPVPSTVFFCSKNYPDLQKTLDRRTSFFKPFAKASLLFASFFLSRPIIQAHRNALSPCSQAFACSGQCEIATCSDTLRCFRCLVLIVSAICSHAQCGDTAGPAEARPAPSAAPAHPNWSDRLDVFARPPEHVFEKFEHDKHSNAFLGWLWHRYTYRPSHSTSLSHFIHRRPIRASLMSLSFSPSIFLFTQTAFHLILTTCLSLLFSAPSHHHHRSLVWSSNRTSICNYRRLTITFDRHLSSLCCSSTFVLSPSIPIVHLKKIIFTCTRPKFVINYESISLVSFLFTFASSVTFNVSHDITFLSFTLFLNLFAGWSPPFHTSVRNLRWEWKKKLWILPNWFSCATNQRKPNPNSPRPIVVAVSFQRTGSGTHEPVAYLFVNQNITPYALFFVIRSFSHSNRTSGARQVTWAPGVSMSDRVYRPEVDRSCTNNWASSFAVRQRNNETVHLLFCASSQLDTRLSH